MNGYQTLAVALSVGPALAIVAAETYLLLRRDVAAFKVGGIWFLKAGKLRFSFCISRKTA